MVEGTVFSRDPKSGLRRVSGSILIQGVNPQGPPLPFSALEQLYSEMARDIVELLSQQESEFGFAVEAELDWEDGALRLLSPRKLDCDGTVKLRIVSDLLDEGVLCRERALSILSSRDLVVRRLPEPRERRRVARSEGVKARGICVSQGASVGRLALCSADAWELQARGEGVLLLVDSLDLSHRDALLVATGLLIRSTDVPPSVEIPCLCGVEEYALEPGELYTVWADGGEVLEGALKLLESPAETLLEPLVKKLDLLSEIELRWNYQASDTPAFPVRSSVWRIGLCRMEVFFESREEIGLLRKGLAAAIDHRREPLERLEMHIGAAVENLMELLSRGESPVLTVRLFDAPVAWMIKLWLLDDPLCRANIHPALLHHVNELSATQGLRGGRLAELYPDFFDSQVRALARAARAFPEVRLEVMLPGVAAVEEASFFRRRAESVWKSEGLQRLPLGMMLENPRACLLADKFLPYCDFFSFGTGDLTENTFSLSRYDSSLGALGSKLAANPFRVLDLEGVGELMRIACRRLRAASRSVEIGWCGAQAVHEPNLDFVRELDLNYLSLPSWAFNSVLLTLSRQATTKKAP